MQDWLKAEPDRRGWIERELPDDYELISNPNQLVIVLMDYQTASAAEIFIGYLRQLENVVFVGENSAGILQNAGVVSYYLPHSKLPVQFGTSVFSVSV